MNEKNYSLEELADTYLRIVSVGAVYTNRSDIHQAILRKMWIDIYKRGDDRRKANDILHNLDKEIGFIVGVEYDENDFGKMAKKLEGKLKRSVKKECMV